MSYVNTQTKHERLNRASTIAFQRVAHEIDASIPVILETPILENEIDNEIDMAEVVFRVSSKSRTGNCTFKKKRD